MGLQTTAVAEGVKRVALSGRLDIEGTSAVEAAFGDLAKEDGVLLVDMSQIEFVASIGIRLLLGGAKLKAAQGGKLALVGLQPLVKQTLEVTGLHKLIPCYATEQAALAELKG